MMSPIGIQPRAILQNFFQISLTTTWNLIKLELQGWISKTSPFRKWLVTTRLMAYYQAAVSPLCQQTSALAVLNSHKKTLELYLWASRLLKLDCLFISLFRLIMKKTLNPCITLSLWKGWPVDFLHKWSLMWKAFPCYHETFYVIENLSVHKGLFGFPCWSIPSESLPPFCPQCYVTIYMEVNPHHTKQS